MSIISNYPLKICIWIKYADEAAAKRSEKMKVSKYLQYIVDAIFVVEGRCAQAMCGEMHQSPGASASHATGPLLKHGRIPRTY